jgi:thiol-disulfide isomerase/thioredoxin
MNAPRNHAFKRLALIVLGGVAGVAVGLAGVYGIGRLTGNVAVDAACKDAVETARRMAPLARGEVAAVAVAATPKLLPALTFDDGTGAKKTLADWRGRTVLLNLWATWCVPCRKEMPALDALQDKLGGPEFEVVSINIDTRNPEKAKAWLKEVGINKLAYYRQGIPGPESDRQGVRHADHADRRSERLRARNIGRTGGMGWQRRRQARQRGTSEMRPRAFTP